MTNHKASAPQNACIHVHTHAYLQVLLIYIPVQQASEVVELRPVVPYHCKVESVDQQKVHNSIDDKEPPDKEIEGEPPSLCDLCDEREGGGGKL